MGVLLNDYPDIITIVEKKNCALWILAKTEHYIEEKVHHGDVETTQAEALLTEIDEKERKVSLVRLDREDLTVGSMIKKNKMLTNMFSKEFVQGLASEFAGQ